MSSPPSDVTQLLREWSRGDQTVVDQLTPLVYSELRRLADGYMRRERPDHTLQPTALVNEAYVKLFEHAQPEFSNRAHFLAVMARAMRQVLVDHARALGAAKRGGGGRAR